MKELVGDLTPSAMTFRTYIIDYEAQLIRIFWGYEKVIDE